jgi:hypothetical protein
MSCPRRLAGTALLARSGNASSNSISAFAATPPGLHLIGTIGSGGTDPDSVTIAGDHLVYVLSADSKTIAGFWLGYRGLRPIPGSVRPLGAGVLVPGRSSSPATRGCWSSTREVRAPSTPSWSAPTKRRAPAVTTPSIFPLHDLCGQMN